MLRVGPNMIVFNEYESFKQIYAPNPQPREKHSLRRRQRQPHPKPSLLEPPADREHEVENPLGYVEQPQPAESRAAFACFDLDVSVAHGARRWKRRDSRDRLLEPCDRPFRSGQTVRLRHLGQHGEGENQNIMLSPDKHWMPAASLHVSWRAVTVRGPPHSNLFNES